MTGVPKSMTTTETGALAEPPVSRFTVEREISRGHLTAEKVGGRWLIDEDEARRWASAFRRYSGLKNPG